MIQDSILVCSPNLRIPHTAHDSKYSHSSTGHPISPENPVIFVLYLGEYI
jgi:hypothetical protein